MAAPAACPGRRGRKPGLLAAAAAPREEQDAGPSTSSHGGPTVLVVQHPVPSRSAMQARIRASTPSECLVALEPPRCKQSLPDAVTCGSMLYMSTVRQDPHKVLTPSADMLQAEPCNLFATPGTIPEYTRVAVEGSFDHDRSMYIGAHLSAHKSACWWLQHGRLHSLTGKLQPLRMSRERHAEAVRDWR